MFDLSLAVTLAVLAAASCTDMHSYKIPNKVTFPAMAAGLLLCGFPFSARAYIRIAWMCLFFVIGSFRIMGMGDLKLCMAVTALRGIEETWPMMLAGSLILFLYCLFLDPEEAKRGLRDLYCMLKYRVRPARTRRAYPFAVFLALGYGANFLMR